MASGVSPNVDLRTSTGEVNCLWRFTIEIGLPFRVGGSEIDHNAVRPRIVTKVRRMKIVIMRKIIGAKGIRERTLKVVDCLY